MKTSGIEALKCLGCEGGDTQSSPSSAVLTSTSERVCACPSSIGSRRRKTAAFSLIEIIVAVSLLTVIVLGLVYVFGQTQRAFTSSMAQVDVLETGRAVTDMLARELAEMAPSQARRVENFVIQVDAETFSKPLLQDLPVTSYQRTNIVQRFYFLSRQNQYWIGRGYYVLPPEENAGMGTLYRWELSSRTNDMSDDFQAHYDRILLALSDPGFDRQGLSNRVADGIVHLRLLPCDMEGRLITWTNVLQTTNTIRQQNVYIPDQTDAIYMSNAVPASVELEVGVLEPQTMERFRALGLSGADVQRTFLSNRTAQVHIFRQRIPIRNVDPFVYVTNTASK